MRFFIYISNTINSSNMTKLLIFKAKQHFKNVYILFIKDSSKHSFKQNDIIYFLCNSKLIAKIAKRAFLSGAIIINFQYFQSRFSKEEMQKLITLKGISAPKIFKQNTRLPNEVFPIYYKPNKHVAKVILLQNRKEWELFQQNNKNSEYYFEKAIENGYEKKIHFYQQQNFFNQYKQK
jgi:hypothetical protein